MTDARISNPDQVDGRRSIREPDPCRNRGAAKQSRAGLLRLFQSADDFPSNTRGNAASTASTITNRRAECDFENEDPGSYAILVFHDEDNYPCARAEPQRHSARGRWTIEQPKGYLRDYPATTRRCFPTEPAALNLTINVKYPLTQVSDATRSFAASADANASLAGFAFVDGSVTGQGSRAKLPTGTKIYPPGSTITGTDGCPTTRYHTDGMIVAVIDYQGRPTAGSVAVTRHPASGGQFRQRPLLSRPRHGSHTSIPGPHLRKWFLRCSPQI